MKKSRDRRLEVIDGESLSSVSGGSWLSEWHHKRQDRNRQYRAHHHSWSLGGYYNHDASGKVVSWEPGIPASIMGFEPRYLPDPGSKRRFKPLPLR